MFGRSLLLFVLFLICLGLGTIWIVETEAGAHILPRGHHWLSETGLSQQYQSARYKLTDWWYATQGKVSTISHEQETITVNKEKIIKWQDANGTWHFEYQKPTADATK